jgi:hypothetical protein
MARITCRTPSTGKALSLYIANVPTAWTDFAEAPDFSLPDSSEKYDARDPLDASRAIRPGEVFFLTPVTARNKDTVTRWIEVKLISEGSDEVLMGRVEVPAGDTAFLPLQGRSLLKRNPSGANGDRVQLRAETANVFDVWGAAEEKLSSEHTGVIV